MCIFRGSLIKAQTILPADSSGFKIHHSLKKEWYLGCLQLRHLILDMWSVLTPSVKISERCRCFISKITWCPSLWLLGIWRNNYETAYASRRAAQVISYCSLKKFSFCIHYTFFFQAEAKLAISGMVQREQSRTASPSTAGAQLSAPLPKETELPWPCDLLYCQLAGCSACSWSANLLN